jgi:[histone H3]-lysine36 N-dimethyltransferase SETMAR
MQWIKKGSPGPIKAKVQASRTKQMVLAFFDQQGMIFTNYVPLGTTVNAAHIVKILPIFVKQLKRKRATTAAGQWFLHWDNAPVHTAAVVHQWLIKHNIQVLPHPPYSPDLAPADFFLFPKVKEHLADITLTQDTLRSTWERAIRTITAEGFAAAYRRWLQRKKKCVHIGGVYVEKS